VWEFGGQGSVQVPAAYKGPLGPWQSPEPIEDAAGPEVGVRHAVPSILVLAHVRRELFVDRQRPLQEYAVLGRQLRLPAEPVLDEPRYQ
jgi:hypothetical protein